MEASELMIGDWVLWNGTPSRVHTITASEQIRLSNPMELSELDYMHNLNIEPIPLTEEILKANGFNEYGAVWDFPSNSFLGVMIDTSLKGIYPTTNETAFFRCGYVHELQHALRLCGLSELADNFKV